MMWLAMGNEVTTITTNVWDFEAMKNVVDNVGLVDVLLPKHVFVVLLLDVNLMGTLNLDEGCMGFFGYGLGFLFVVCSSLKNIKEETRDLSFLFYNNSKLFFKFRKLQ